MPLKKAVRSKTSAGAKKSARSAKARKVTGRIGAGAIAIALITVVAVALVIAAAQESSDRPELITADAGPQAVAGQLLPRKSAAMRAASDAVPAPAPTTGAEETNASDSESATAPAKKPSPVTIAGCLERSDNAFRLKDATGADVPKSRSWKSGFLKKNSASIDLRESGNGLRLRDQVGKRVSVTGTLSDRQMRVQSVRRVGASCS
jgi:hypothetical protein